MFCRSDEESGRALGGPASNLLWRRPASNRPRREDKEDHGRANREKYGIRRNEGERLKACLRILGLLDHDTVRPPFAPIPAEEYGRLEKALRHAGAFG